MQTQIENSTPESGSQKKYGRPPGRLSSSTIRQKAVRLLEESVLDETLPRTLRVEAALKLLEETRL